MAPPRNTYRNSRRNETPPEQLVVESVIKAVGALIGLIFKAMFKGGSGTKKVGTNRQEIEKLQEHWQDVEMHALQESTRALAISEGDKILDNAFKILGYKGESMADRLRNAETKLGSDLYQKVWDAHKLRNALAHEVGAKASAQEAEYAISTFRQALYKLGILS